MNRKWRIMMAGIALAMPAFNASGQAAPPAPALSAANTGAGGTCAMLSVQLKFKFKGKSGPGLKEEFDKKIHRLEEFASTQHIQRFEMQSMNFSLQREGGHKSSSIQPGYGVINVEQPPNLIPHFAEDAAYVLTGDAEYFVPNSDSAFKLGHFLTEEKFEVTVASKTINAPCPAASGSGAAVPAVPAAPASTNPPPAAPPVTSPPEHDLQEDLSGEGAAPPPQQQHLSIQ